MAKKVLIAGAAGLIGSRLTEVLLQKGFEVSHLGRSWRSGFVASYVWDVKKGAIDPYALQDVDVVINLAGAGVADKRWTIARKKEILDSRIQSTNLLYNELKKGDHQVTCFISASAIGYYGLDKGAEWQSEMNPPGTDFLAEVVRRWEEEVEKIESLNVRVVKMRIGIVLSEKGGALKSMATPIRLGFGAALGNGKQYMTWIHIDDLCAIFVKACEDSNLNGAYNAAGVQAITNLEMTKAIAKILNKPLWLPPVPSFALKLMLGELANMVLYGSKISVDKIQRTGFVFEFTEIEKALENLLLR